MQRSTRAKLASLAVAAAGTFLQATLAHADALKPRCDADSLTPAMAKLRLEWARACGTKINVVSPTSPRPPAIAYNTGLFSSNGSIPLWEYIETDDFWGRNSYSGDVAAVNQAFTQNQWRSGAYIASTDANGFQRWTESSSLALTRPTYPVFGTSFDPGSGVQLYPNPNYALVDCRFYTDRAATQLADTSVSGFYMNGYCPSSDIPISGLHMWLRSDMGVTRSSNNVSQWLDQSGNGRNASMATAGRQPLYVTGAVNGLPVLRFSGAQSMDMLAQPTNFSVFIVGKNNMPTETFSMILGPGGNSPNNQIRWENGSNALFYGGGDGMPVITSPIWGTRIYHELSTTYTGATMTIYRNGSAVTTQSFAATGPWTLASLGSYYSSYYLNGDIAEVIIYDRALSSSERALVDSYLQVKYFLTCGNGVCDSNENSSTCPGDCSICGDGICTGFEDAWSCPGDCSFCGDGICSGTESSRTCPDDCGISCLIAPCQTCLIAPCLLEQ